MTLNAYRKTLISIDNEAVFLQEMVEKLLLISRIQNMGIRKNFTMIDLDDILLETFEEFRIIAKIKGVSLDIDTIEYLPIQGDPTLLKILFSNLIDNAIKFTPKGKKVTLSLVKSVVTIADEGIGIPREKLPLIFDEFYRITPPGKKHIKGYGLGLSIVKKIALIHKLKMEIRSQHGQGTQVILAFRHQV
jgi:signal transduction histidine kinase